MSKSTEISAIVPVGKRHDDVQELYHAYKNSLQSTGCKYEVIYVLDGNFPQVFEQLRLLQDKGEQIKIIKLAKQFGEATALTAGF